MKIDKDDDAKYAEKVAQLPREVQKQIIALIRGPASNPKVDKYSRRLAKERADSLEKHLRRLNRRKKKM